MNRTIVDRIAEALLYEGYLLYPYRPSVKNRQRWTFGGLYPAAYSAAQAGTDPSSAQTECLLEPGAEARVRVRVRVRFLHLLTRRHEPGDAPDGARRSPPQAPGVSAPPTWQEAVERGVDLGESDLEGLLGQPRDVGFTFPSAREQEPWLGPAGEPLGTVIREQNALAGRVEVAAERVAEGLIKLTVRVGNATPFEVGERADRDAALLRALVSTHAILGVSGGEFVSLLDPPEAWREFAAGCRNVGLWPVLAGEPGQKDTMLASPIILYDYPQVAPESPGDLFDATEIDEILTLRILTLTDEEKQAMTAVDDRARALLERTEALAREQLMGLHGTIRGLHPLSAESARDPWTATHEPARLERIEPLGGEGTGGVP